MIPCNDLLRSYNLFKNEFEEAAINTLRSGRYILGENCSSFESEFSKLIGSKYCISCDNGTNAIFLGLKALGIGPDDEVIVQTNTYIATVMGITRNGAKPIFVEPNDFYNMSDAIDDKIGPKTKAILVTHLFGQATKLNHIIELCEKHKIYLLEDCAQAHFATYNGKYVGTIGKIGFFSFYPTKNVGALGDAGCLVTDDEEVAKRLFELRNYGSTKRYHFDIDGGINSRMDELQAAFLRVRLKHVKDLTEEKKKIATAYLNGIKNNLVKLPKIDDGCTSVWHLFVLEVEDRDAFMHFLREKGVDSDIHYPIPPHLSKCYSYLGYRKGDFPIAEYLSEHIVDIPIFNGMTDSEISTVIEAINEYE